MPTTRNTMRKKANCNDVEGKENIEQKGTRVSEAKVKTKKIEENLEDSFSFQSKDKNPPDRFDLLCSSPMKQEVNFKPLTFWSKKVKDLESKENLKKKKCELYELSDTDDSNSSRGTSYRGKKPRKKRRPAVGRQRNKKIGFDFNTKNLLKNRSVKSRDENKEGSIVRERIILRRLNDKIAEEEKFSFKNVTAFGLTSTPGKSEKLNLVGGSTFDFLSPIPIPAGDQPVPVDNHSESEGEIKKTEKNFTENKEIFTPRRLRKRNDAGKVVTKDRTRVSGSDRPTVDHLENSNNEPEWGEFFRDRIDNSKAEIESLTLSTDGMVLGVDSFEDYRDKLNTSFLYVTEDDVNGEMENSEFFRGKYSKDDFESLPVEVIQMLYSLKILFKNCDSEKKLIDLSCCGFGTSPLHLPYHSMSLPVGEDRFRFESVGEFSVVEDSSATCEAVVGAPTERNSFSNVTVRRCYNCSNVRRSAEEKIFDEHNGERNSSVGNMANGGSLTVAPFIASGSRSLCVPISEDVPSLTGETIRKSANGVCSDPEFEIFQSKCNFSENEGILERVRQTRAGERVAIKDWEGRGGSISIGSCTPFDVCTQKPITRNCEVENVEDGIKSDTNSDGEIYYLDSCRDCRQQLKEEIEFCDLANGNDPNFGYDASSKIPQEVIQTLYLLKILFTHDESELKMIDLSCCGLRPSPPLSNCHSVSLPVGEGRTCYGSEEEFPSDEDQSATSETIVSALLNRNSFSNVTVRRCYNGFSNFRRSAKEESFEVARCGAERIGTLEDFVDDGSLGVAPFLSKDSRSSCNSNYENFLLKTGDRESFSANQIVNVDQQTHGKSAVNLRNDVKTRSNRYCSIVESINPTGELLDLYSDAGNDSSVLFSSPETSKTFGSLNCSVCHCPGDSGKVESVDDVGVTATVLESSPEMNRVTEMPRIGVKCYRREKKQGSSGKTVESPITKNVLAEQTMSDLTINEEIDFPLPIFESTKCSSPTRERSMGEAEKNGDDVVTEFDNSILETDKNRSGFGETELSNVTSCRLKPGKKWARSALILKKSLNETLWNQPEVRKGRMYKTFVEEVLNMQSVVQDQSSADGLDGSDTSVTSLLNKMSYLSIKSHAFGNRTVKVMADVAEDEAMDCSFRSIFINSGSEKRNSTVVDWIDGSTALEVTAMEKTLMSAKGLVLKYCNQTEPLPFEEIFNQKTLKQCRKIGEGTFGEVFMSGSDRVIKIIPIEGSDEVNGEPQKKFDEVLSEMVVAQELSDLRNGKEHRTDGFSELSRSWCIVGKYPQYLIDLWNEFDSLGSGSENDSPIMFKSDQLYIAWEFKNGGKDLESFVFNTSEQALSILFQAAYSLAVAEKVLEFEHRDLHWGNLLIAPTKKKHFEVVLNGEEIQIPTKGVKVTIIDFTLSRVTYDGCCVYNDLSTDLTLFMSEGDYQFEIYRMMKRELGNDWSLFRPKTNLYWLHYVTDKMVKMARYQRPCTKNHKTNLEKLDQIQRNILKFSDSEDFALNCHIR